MIAVGDIQKSLLLIDSQIWRIIQLCEAQAIKQLSNLV